MKLEVLLGIAGSIASIVALLYAASQHVRVRHIRQRVNADLWTSLRTTTAIIERLEASGLESRDPQIADVYGKVVELYRSLLRQAVLDERKFDETTICRWSAAGKLHTKWQVAQARHLLPTARIRHDANGGSI